jgi:hypothetical protein
MPRVLATVDEEKKRWIESQSDSLGVSEAEVIRRLIDAGRSDESLVDSRVNHDSQVNHRIDELETRLSALESRLSDTTREDGSDSPLSASDPDRIDTLREDAPEDGLRAVDADEVRGRVRDTFADRSRMDPDTVDAVATAAAFLAERGDAVSTKELKEHTYAEFGERYSSERSMWNSIDRYLEELPFVEKPGYGKWRHSTE